MSALQTILANAIDLRAKLPVSDNPPGYRKSRVPRSGAVTTQTLHYNGPPISDRSVRGTTRQLISIDAPNHISRIGADSLQYHICVGAGGEYYYTRNFELQAWHCGIYEGNEHSIAIHVPLGGDQDPTNEQWASTIRLFDAVNQEYQLGGRAATMAHLEWKPTACPGLPLMRRLNTWRTAVVPLPISPATATYKVVGMQGANVRVHPTSKSKAVNACMFDSQVEVVNIVAGEKVSGVNQWAQLYERGYIWLPLLRRI